MNQGHNDMTYHRYLATADVRQLSISGKNPGVRKKGAGGMIQKMSPPFHQRGALYLLSSVLRPFDLILHKRQSPGLKRLNYVRVGDI